jgi:hypothetical protein
MMGAVCSSPAGRSLDAPEDADGAEEEVHIAIVVSKNRTTWGVESYLQCPFVHNLLSVVRWCCQLTLEPGSCQPTMDTPNCVKFTS